MKNTLFILALFCFLFMGCTTSEDEPNNNFNNNKTDWIVTYTEYLYSNPQWINKQNTSAECLKWKELHQQYAISHISIGANNEERTVWEVNYKNLTESEVEQKILEFVKFTITTKVESENKTKYGSNIFMATLTDSKRTRYARYRHMSPLFWFDSSNCRYRIAYIESRIIQDGDWVPEPPMLDDWIQDREPDFSSETSNTRSRIWYEDTNEWTISDVHTKINPFVNWTIGNENAKSFHRLNVRVHDYEDDITIWYSKYNTTN